MGGKYGMLSGYGLNWPILLGQIMILQTPQLCYQTHIAWNAALRENLKPTPPNKGRQPTRSLCLLDNDVPILACRLCEVTFNSTALVSG